MPLSWLCAHQITVQLSLTDFQVEVANPLAQIHRLFGTYGFLIVSELLGLFQLHARNLEIGTP